MPEKDKEELTLRILDECDTDRSELIPRLKDITFCLSQLESRVQTLEGQHYTLNNLSKEIKENVEVSLSDFKKNLDDKFDEKFESFTNNLQPLLDSKIKLDAFLKKMGFVAIIFGVLIIPSLSVSEIRQLIKSLFF